MIGGIALTIRMVLLDRESENNEKDGFNREKDSNDDGPWFL
jgi:hypothetical protein